MWILLAFAIKLKFKNYHNYILPGLRCHDLDHCCRDLTFASQVGVNQHGRGIHLPDVVHDITHLQGHERDHATRGGLLALRSLLILGSDFRHHLGAWDERQIRGRNSGTFWSQAESCSFFVSSKNIIDENWLKILTDWSWIQKTQLKNLWNFYFFPNFYF